VAGSLEDLIDQADQAELQAKSASGDRVLIHDAVASSSGGR